MKWDNAKVKAAETSNVLAAFLFFPSAECVDQEGIEPSSKRGNNMLSTCLSSLWFSCRNKTEATHSCLEPLNISPQPRGRPWLFPIWLHRYIKTLRKNCSWAMSRSNTSLVGIKLTYYTSIRQRERSCFRQLNFWKPSFKCPLSGALHAYTPLRPAVKSSLARICRAKVNVSAQLKDFYPANLANIFFF